MGCQVLCNQVGGVFTGLVQKFERDFFFTLTPYYNYDQQELIRKLKVESIAKSLTVSFCLQCDAIKWEIDIFRDA